MRHLLVSNDFPPKVGGIQAYLWELWRRLPPDETFVYTTPYRGADAFDAEQPFWIRRSREPWLLPNPMLAQRINRLADRLDVDLVILDPGIPLGLIAGSLRRPYAIVAHGAEVTVPGRLPLAGHALGRVLRGARLVIAAGRYPGAEAERCAGRPLPTVVIPPGVDVDRFVPLAPADRAAARTRFGLEGEDLVLVSISRLVPRKGMDTLIRAAARLRPRFPALRVVIAGTGRDRDRLGRLVAATGAPAEFVGFIDEADKPALLGCADVFAMLCRNRWAGLEQEGYGIVFAEAAACGVAQLCGRSGGSDEAVGHEETGLVVDRPASVDDAVSALGRLLADAELRTRLGAAARTRAVADFAYDGLARRLREALAGAVPDRAGPVAGERPAGTALIRLSLSGTAVLVVVSALAVAVDGPPRAIAAVVALVLFVAGSLAYLLGYARAVRRSRVDEISLPGLVFLAGVAPAPVRRLLLGSTLVEIVVVVTAAAVRPFTTLAFGILAPVFGLGLQSLWSARHGRFPLRAVARPRPS